MLSWFKRKPRKPETYGHALNVQFQKDERTWSEELDLVEILFGVFQEQGYKTVKREHSVFDPETGFILTPEVLSLDPAEDVAQTCSIITITHPELIEGEIFEYQHSAGEDLLQSFRTGFEMWEQTDYAVLKEVGKARPDELPQFMDMTRDDGVKRRVLFGPVAHMVDDPQAHEAASQCNSDGDHPFCPCCLFTNSIETFKGLVDSNDFCALRLFASRDEHGQASADCRVNGHDDKAGIRALAHYATTWPEAGFEFRKQYVIIYSV